MDGFPFLDIVFFAMLAIFLGLRLRNVLGRRTGTEKRRPDPFKPAEPAANVPDNVVKLPERDRKALETLAAETDTPLARGIKAIKQADRNFDEVGFIGGARAAFEMIVTSFAKGDVGSLRPLLADGVFDGGEADHFATDFGKPFQAAEDMDEPIVIDADHITGVVPAIKGLKRGIGVGVEVAAHDVGPADEEFAALGDAFDGFSFPFHTWEEASDGSGLGFEPRVDGDGGAAFGRSVAFEDTHAKFTGPCLHGGVLDFFGAGDEKLD